MSENSTEGTGEVLLSQHSENRWRRRRAELRDWTQRTKVQRQQKQTLLFGEVPVDEELYPALKRLRDCGIRTHFSCAGVSPLDEPIDHSLYAYITFSTSGQAERLVSLIMEQMKHRAMMTFDPVSQQYDVSSFFIGHNRSFCILIKHCADQLEVESNPAE